MNLISFLNRSSTGQGDEGEIVATGPAPVTRYRRRLWRWLSVLLVVCCIVAVALTWIRPSELGQGLAGAATVSASSTGAGFSARNAVTSGRPEQPGAAWQSAGETVGAWLELAWSRSVEIHNVVLVRNALTEPGVTEGFLQFGDGSYLQVRFDPNSRITSVPVTSRTVDRLRFTASTTNPGAQHVAIAEVLVNADSAGSVVVDRAPGGNVALTATSRIGPAAGANDSRALHDGSGGPDSAGIGDEWHVEHPEGAWAQLSWSTPREVSTIELLGGPSGAHLTAATVSFSDGAQLPIGAVLPDPDRPTILSFMPRVTTSLRLTIDRVAGSGALALAEWRVYQRGATPARETAHGATPSSSASTSSVCPRSASDPGRSEIEVHCPVSGSVVSDSTTLSIGVPGGYRSVSADVWPAEDDAPSTPTVRSDVDAAGQASVDLDLTSVPAGPLTVAVYADGPARAAKVAYFQLFKRGSLSGDVPSSAPAAGRTLVYAEEFNRPVSLSRTGLGAEYAAAKPVFDGAQDFGDGVFADPARGFGNVRVVDDHYLRIDAEPLPDGFADPGGWGRQHLGGLLASARPGGSGFSAQYGYFEARMLVPAANGTWPAFWMLPSDNLVELKHVVAEVDAVELYGHDPQGACHSSHEYHDGKAGGGVARCGERFVSARQALSWHTYGVSISPSTLRYYIDGHEVATAPQVQGGGAPMFFMVNLALGGGWPVALQPVQNRATLYVDYVRVYV
jgi:hypothetical protein